MNAMNMQMRRNIQNRPIKIGPHSMKIFSFLSRKLHDATRSNSAENWQRPKSKQSRRVIKINNSKQAKMFSQDAPPGPCVDAIWRVQRRSIKSSEKKNPVTSSSPPELWNTHGGCTNKHGRNESCWPSGHPQCFLHLTRLQLAQHFN
jgi:hypothetical protein